MKQSVSLNKKSYQFEQETFAQTLKNTRLATVSAIIAFSLFTILDFLIYRDYLFQFLYVRFGLIAISLIINVLTRLRPFNHFPRALAMAEYLNCCLGIALMIHISRDPASPYYAGINTIFIIFTAMMPLDLRSTMIVSIIVYGAYLLPPLILQRVDNFPVFLNNNFFLLTTIVLVNISAHLSHQMRFREFSGRFDLAKANDELKQLDTLKSQFFANVSHEVRTPLTSIIAPVESMFQGDAGPLHPEQQHLVGQVYRNSLKLLDMINQMLDFSKFEAGRMTLRLKYTDLDELCRDIASTFQDVTEHKGLKLHYVNESPIKPLYLDSEKIERILTNLIRNAIKFTERGSITVRTGSMIGKAWIEVRDTGIGIPKEHLSNIFKRFQQADGSSTRKYEGTGLGLTIAKESVELMRGSIEVHSEEGRGSTFRITFPDNLDELVPDASIDRRRVPERRLLSSEFEGEERRKGTRRVSDSARISTDDLVLIERDVMKMREIEPVESPAQQTLDRVLLVEDNIDLRNYISKQLANRGHHIRTAIDGLDGWEQALNHLPDIVVSDIMMPRMDGIELLRKIKETDETLGIPVILMTAKSELEAKLEGLKQGADDYLPKPISIRELDARIKNLVTARSLQQSLGREEELQRHLEELTISFSESLEMRDLETANHCRDLLHLGSIIAEALGIPIDRKLKDSLLLHDIGKLAIPDAILKKPAPLTKQEWEVMKTHPAEGARIVGRHPHYREISDIILSHQEHFDGTGYPRGLKEEQIPIIARIIATADAYHAMTTDRPYRRAMPPKEAALELLRHRGTQFDPKVVDAFIKGLLKLRLIEQEDLKAPA